MTEGGWQSMFCAGISIFTSDRSKGLNYPLACKSMNWMVFTLYPPLLLLFCNAIVWSIANPLLSEGGTRCYSSQRQFPHCRRLSVPLPISSTLFPRALFYIFFLFRTMYLKRLQISNNCRRLSVPMSISSTFFSPLWRCLQTGPPQKCLDCPSKFPCCVLLALSWNKRKSKNR